VQAILDVLGQQGTLVVPAMTPDNRDPSTWNPPPPEREWGRMRETLPPFDPAKTPSVGVGVVAEQVRRWPGSARSAHPQSSFAAVGARAAELMADHRLESHLGEESPLSKLVAVSARVLLLGVGYATTTAFHLGEYRRRNPPMRDYSCAVLRAGERVWVTYRDVDLDASDFEDLGKAFEYECDMVHTSRVGEATAKLFPLSSAVDFAGSWIDGNRPDTQLQTGFPVR
jgi:aminoglycoside 3-N-acetyltransferase